MTRQNIVPNPSRRLFEAYMDFSGGRNSETSNERLRDNEYPVLDNVDLSSRGSARRRWGRRLLASQTGRGQGLFFFYRSGQAKPDTILAIGGNLSVIENGTTLVKPITIMDGTNPFTFQALKPIEAVQYGTDMFIATGTKFCELTYDTASSTWKAKVVIPYSPTVMEAIYIGTNGLAANPDAYVQDGTSTALEVVGIKPPMKSGVVNQKMTLVAYINKPATVTGVDYKWEYKRSSEANWLVGRDYTADAPGKTWDFLPDTATKWDIRVTVRATSTTTPTPQYALTGYVVDQVMDKANTSRPVNGIQRCRKVMLFWDRLIMTGDDTNPFQLYISDLNAPRYFPVTNTISFDMGKQEPITSMIRYRDVLIVFTKTTIQTLTGTSPENYQRGLVHEGIGCIAERGVGVTGSLVMFLSAEGVHTLKPHALRMDMFNVQRVDYPIKTEVLQDVDACTMVYDSQFWICFPSSSSIFRLYYDSNMWVRDKSTKLNFSQITHYGADVLELSLDGRLYQQDKGLWTDDGEIYDMVVESKFLDLEASFNFKKLKRLMVLGRHYPQNVELKVKVQADSAIVLTPEDGHAEITPGGYSVWMVTTTPNMEFFAGTVIGSWILGKTPLGDVQISVQKTQVRGKCRRVKVNITHSQATPCELFGFGLEFKEKKP